jgi:hypothetical protein
VIQAGAGNIMINGSNYTMIGSGGSSSQGLVSNDDLFINGILEIDGQSYFDGVANFDTTIVIGTNDRFTSSLSVGSLQMRNTKQTPDAPMFLTGILTNHYIIAEAEDEAIDFAHPLQSNPTLFIQSNGNTSLDEWLGFTYLNASNEGVISTGKGDLRLNATGQINASDNNLTNVDHLFVNTIHGGSPINVADDLNMSENDITNVRNLTYDAYIGEVWFHNDTSGVITTTINTQDVWENVTGFNSSDSGNLLRGFSFDSLDTYLSPSFDGTYKVDYSVSFLGGSNTHYQFSIAVNGVLQPQTDSHRKIGAAADVGNTGGTGYISLSAGDLVQLQVRNIVNTNDINPLAANVNLERKGN